MFIFCISRISYTLYTTVTVGSINLNVRSRGGEIDQIDKINTFRLIVFLRSVFRLIRNVLLPGNSACSV